MYFSRTHCTGEGTLAPRDQVIYLGHLPSRWQSLPGPEFLNGRMSSSGSQLPHLSDRIVRGGGRVQMISGQMRFLPRAEDLSRSLWRGAPPPPWLSGGAARAMHLGMGHIDGGAVDPKMSSQPLGYLLGNYSEEGTTAGTRGNRLSGECCVKILFSFKGQRVK